MGSSGRSTTSQSSSSGSLISSHSMSPSSASVGPKTDAGRGATGVWAGDAGGVGVCAASASWSSTACCWSVSGPCPPRACDGDSVVPPARRVLARPGASRWACCVVPTSSGWDTELKAGAVWKPPCTGVEAVGTAGGRLAASGTTRGWAGGSAAGLG
eukprot:CAMPEP_0204449736 /NCGR_PEP_ID=MMETSP0470-20130426/99992_1 /ASSEMBLY_ACC=CAM_ASM_000385 /TAXON_ID=2969 /ORGANISM="Oxyrrhis marina" /LENGTH=156 /DNA_ID=CAMNT_0051449559 /DNA_START=757 /DNA_END=1223 /DNA_ORIENTATION=+